MERRYSKMTKKELIKLLRFAEKKMSNHEQRLTSLEFNLTHVPCSIEDDFKGIIWCEEPFCKFMHYSKLAKEAFDDWQKKIIKEISDHENSKPAAKEAVK